MSREQANLNRWWVVVGSILGMIVCNGPVLQFTFGLFVNPLSEEMGWSRGTISLALTVGGLLTAVSSPFAGAAIDRWGVRKVTLISITLFSVAIASIGLASSPASLIVLYGVAGLVGAGQAPLSYARAITSLFDRKRGLALGLALAGIGLGAAIMPQFARIFIDAWGWRGAYVGLGVLSFVVAFPVVALLVREGRDEVGYAGDSGRDLKEALRDRRFWLIAAAILLVAAATNGTIAHAVPLLRDRGIPVQAASAALGVSGIALIGGRLLAGYMLDRVFAPFVALACFLLPVAGIAMLWADGGIALSLTGIFLVGFGLGAEGDLIAYLVSRYFGLKFFGRLYGCVFFMFAVGSGVGPLVMGRVYDANGSYGAALVSFCGCLIVSALFMLFLGPYSYSTRSAGAEDKMAAQPAQ